MELMQNFWKSLPESFAKPSAAVLFLFILVVIWSLPVKRIYEEKPSLIKDLRIWSTFLLAFQIIIYTIF